METQAYIDQLKAYAEEFQEWWIKPYENFYTDFEEQNKKLFLGFLPIKNNNKESKAKFNEAAKQFEEVALQKRNLFREIFEFLNTNYETYLKATDLHRQEIRSIVSDTFYNLRYEERPLSYYESSYMQMIIKKYRGHAFKEFKSTSDEIWLTRALVAVSIEDCCCDFRETLTYLSRLYVTAEQKNIEPKRLFDPIAEISSNEIKIGYSTPLSEIIMNIGSYEVTKYERSIQKR
jgi:hypothetical protein